MIRDSIVLCLLLLFAHTVCAQEFRYKADLGEVEQTGFYKIPLGADVRGKAKLHLGDIRIRDGKGNFVPFVVLPPEDGMSVSSFREYPIVSRTMDTAGNTLLVIENTGGEIGNISLVIKNNEVSRTADLSGSDDGQEWFAIREDLQLLPAPGLEYDQFIHTVDFPVVRYRYIRLAIHNQKKEPLNITRAGVYQDGQPAGNKIHVDNFGSQVTQTDSSDGYTYIYIDQKEHFPVDILKLTIKGPKFFERDAYLYTLTDSLWQIGAQPGAFTLSSRNARDMGGDTVFNKLTIPETIHTQRLLLKIHNGDNPLLRVLAVTTYHRQATLCAYLEKNKTYELRFGKEDAAFPDYDLTRFKDSIPNNAPALSHGVVMQAGINDAGEGSAQENQLLLWIVITGAVALLGFFSWKLVREMNAQK